MSGVRSFHLLTADDLFLFPLPNYACTLLQCSFIHVSYNIYRLLLKRDQFIRLNLNVSCLSFFSANSETTFPIAGILALLLWNVLKACHC